MKSAGISADLERLIVSGAWEPGARIPTEHALMAQYGCARMTVHTALAGLAARGLIVRRRRAGSFVGVPPAERAVLTIADFAAEAARDGKAYRHRIVDLWQCVGGGGFAATEALVRVTCLHLFDALPVAWEDRLIRIASVPGVAQARFCDEPPGAWLLRHVPWSAAEHEITAEVATIVQAGQLEVAAGSALLCLRRRTWHDDAVVTEVRLTFPAARYRLTGRFSPG